jgi:hypothetical protein
MVCILQLIFAFIFFSLEFFLFLLLNFISLFPLFDCFSSMRKQAENPHFFHFEAKQFSLLFRPFRFETKNTNGSPYSSVTTPGRLDPLSPGPAFCSLDFQDLHVLSFNLTCIETTETNRPVFRNNQNKTPKKCVDSTATGTAWAGLL